MAVDIRDAFFEEVYNLGKKDRNVVFLTDDMDAFALKKFKKELSSQFINIGVAEQNMVNVAAGLAACGKKVFAYGISSFITLRCFEQIKINLCSMRLPVCLIGVGPGFSFGFDGPTHHGTQDVALMRVLPEMTIYNPSDNLTAIKSVRAAYEAENPSYIRLDKGVFPPLSDTEKNFDLGFRILKPLKETNLIVTGFMTSMALEIAEALHAKSVDIGVVDLFRLKPVSKEFLETVIGASKEIITLEENSLIGGLGSLVAEAVADRKKPIQLQRLGVKDKQFLSYGSREWLLQSNGLTSSEIVSFLSQKGNRIPV